jgi:hypothetical protein
MERNGGRVAAGCAENGNFWGREEVVVRAEPERRGAGTKRR